MPPLTITFATTALMGLLMIYLSVQVILERGRSKTSLGDGAEGASGSSGSPLFCAVRSHANFAEYVPLCLLLIGGVESSSAPRSLTLCLAAALVIARIVHPIGLRLKAPNPFRAGGTALTLLVLLLGSITLLVRVLTR